MCNKLRDYDLELSFHIGSKGYPKSGRQYRYPRILVAADSLAHYFKSLGLEKGDHVAVLLYMILWMSLSSFT
jgi:acyl-coenzyme A synthetase/AMP-(fatty) acid ligase